MLNKRESTCESKMIAPTKQRMLADRLLDAGQLGKAWTPCVLLL